jgi:hypothetical protein
MREDMNESRKVCKTCVFFNGSDCEFFSENTITTDAGKESCIMKIDRYEGEDPRKNYFWTCCGGILLDKEEKCSVCGEKYEE